jgi:CRP-like cAMP-binding protein
MEQHSYDKLCAKVTLQVFSPGSVIYQQGDAGHHAYIVLFGAVAASVRSRVQMRVFLLVMQSYSCDVI